MSMGRGAIAAACLAMTLAVPGCADTGGDAMSAESWIGITWRVGEIEGSRVPAAIEATLSFPEPGRIAGLAGCNRYTGSLELQGDRIVSLGPLAATRRMCPPEVMEQEQRLLAALPRADRLVRGSDSLLIFAEGEDAPLLRLKLVGPDEPSP